MYLHLDYRNMITLYQLRLFSTSDLKYAGTNDYTCNCPCIQQLCTLSHQSVVWMLMALRISIWVAATAVVSVPELSHQVYLNGLYWDKSANSYLMPLGYTEYQVICFLNAVWYPLSTDSDVGIRFNFAYHPCTLDYVSVLWMLMAWALASGPQHLQCQMLNVVEW